MMCGSKILLSECRVQNNREAEPWHGATMLYWLVPVHRHASPLHRHARKSPPHDCSTNDAVSVVSVYW